MHAVRYLDQNFVGEDVSDDSDDDNCEDNADYSDNDNREYTSGALCRIPWIRVCLNFLHLKWGWDVGEGGWWLGRGGYDVDIQP